jgi:hypothetical protein
MAPAITWKRREDNETLAKTVEAFAAAKKLEKEFRRLPPEVARRRKLVVCKTCT